MSPAVVSFLFTIGASAWIYTKLQKYSGNNTRQSVIGAAIAFIVIFFVFYSLFHRVVNR